MRWLIRLFIPFCSVMALTGCSGPDSRPSGVLPRDKMQLVLWDMIEADQYSLLYLSRDSARINVKAETAGRYEQVFQLYKISKEEFEKSIRYYFSRPDIAEPLFDSLAAMGTRKRTEDYNHGRVNTPNNTAPNNAAPGKAPMNHPFPVAPIPGHGPVPGHRPIPPGGTSLPVHTPAPGHAPVPGPVPIIPGRTLVKPAPKNDLSGHSPGRKPSDTTRRGSHPSSHPAPGKSLPLKQ
ncbi:MAG: DUF4296 domain-containing protein [Puia sp.]|nr:DUF4296 domain-containing protein [Puia sp.]